MSRVTTVVLASLVVRSAFLEAQEAPPQQSVAFTHVTVIDGSGAPPTRDATVVVRGDRIVAVGPAATTRVPAGARAIDGRGKFLIPGLWDMHVHTVIPGGRQLLGLYIANGVTGVRDMAGDWPTLTRWRSEIARGTLIGPRIAASGPYLEGADIPIAHLLVRNPDEARAAIDSLARLGVDFVKIHGRLTRESYFAAARHARARNLVFGGHIPTSVTAAEASDSGQKSLEHLLRIPNTCTGPETEELKPRFPLQSVFGPCTSDDLSPLFARFVRNGTWIVPTMVAAYEFAVLPKRELEADTLLRYIPDTLRRYVRDLFQLPNDIPADADIVGRRLFDKRVRLVGAMHHAGVQLLAGTDAPVRNSPPGFGLHEELAYLVRAGLSPMDALRAATAQPARYFGTQDSAGTVALGKVADLVLLAADPLADIRNTRRISAVVASGRLYDEAALGALLREIEGAAKISAP